MIIWFCGAAGSGKTTLSKKLGYVVLDGDEVRQWLTPDCNQMPITDRVKHLCRVFRVATLIDNAGGIVVGATVQPPPYPLRPDLLILLIGRQRCKPWKGTHWPQAADIKPDLILDTGLETKQQCLAKIQEAINAIIGV